MRITDLDPRWINGILVINCPCGKCGGRLKIRTTRAPEDDGDSRLHWSIAGEYPNISLTPSIDNKCWHGFITDGNVTSV